MALIVLAVGLRTGSQAGKTPDRTTGVFYVVECRDTDGLMYGRSEPTGKDNSV